MSRGIPEDVGGLAAAFAPGSLVAGYRLERRVGRGGMAVVFQARDERLGRLVAIKILSPALAADEGFRQRFIRESRAAAAVDDPHIIPIYEAGEAEGVLFIAMRYVPGGDVRTLIDREGPLSSGRVAGIISPVASALDAAHAAGLVHRDVKPANMLVDARPGRPAHVYLSDFGLSKGAASTIGLTGSGQFLGTPGYSAPEQIQGKAVDGRADQYSLACAAFELLSAEPVFPRAHATAVIWAHMSEQPPLLTARRPGLPPNVDGVLAKALAKTRQDRYATCGEFAGALREALGLAPYDSGAGNVERARPSPAHVASRPDTAVNEAMAVAMPTEDAAGSRGRPRERPSIWRTAVTSRSTTQHPARHARASRLEPSFPSTVAPASESVNSVSRTLPSPIQRKSSVPRDGEHTPVRAGASRGRVVGHRSGLWFLAIGTVAALATAGLILYIAIPGNTGRHEVQARVYSDSNYGFSSPSSIAVAGTHVWVSNNGGNSVTELNASDGRLERILTLGVYNPAAIAVSDGHVWIANAGIPSGPSAGRWNPHFRDSVTEVNASDGRVIRTRPFAALSLPSAIAVAGNHVWVASNGNNSVLELNASNGHLVRLLSTRLWGRPDGTVSSLATGTGHIWVANTGGSVAELNASNGKLVRIVSGSPYRFNDPVAIAVSGNHAWVLNNVGSVTELNASDGSLVRIVSGSRYRFNDPVAIAVTDNYVWVANDHGNSVTELSAMNGNLVRVLLGGHYGFNGPEAITGDGNHVWVANSLGRDGGSVTDLSSW